MNCKRDCYEFQVIQIPGKYNEWLIVYSEWKSDDGAPIGNGGYIPANLLYTRVRYSCQTLDVLERDVPLKANGTAYTYTCGIAASLSDDGTNFYLYGCRRSSSSDFLSLDRFMISSTGIVFDKNTGNIPEPFAYYNVQGASLLVSNDGKRIALSNRNQNYNDDDIIIFDAQQFNNSPSSYQAISVGNLMLQPDNQLLFSEMSVNDAANTIPQLNLLHNMEQKILQLAFSPSGRFLYFSHGGFDGNSNFPTYLGQIEIGTVDNPETYPYKVRVQIEATLTDADYESFNPLDSRAQWDATRHIQQCFDGNMYVCKWASPYLWVLPDPDSLIHCNLIPGIIDNSDADHPNILTNGSTWWGPDQVEGYNYIQSINPLINLGNDTSICTGYQLTLALDEQFQSYCWQDGSSGPTYTTSTAGLYWVEVMDEFGCIDRDSINVIANGLSVNIGDDFSLCPGDSAVISPGPGFQQYLWQDGSQGSSLVVKQPGLFWVEVTQDVDCSARDSVSVTLVPKPIIDLGQDMSICEGESVTLDAGSGFTSYLWDDGSAGRFKTVSDSLLHWVEVQNLNGCKSRDSIIIYINPIPEVDLGSDTVELIENPMVLDAGPGYASYLWQDGSTGQTLTVTDEGLYWVQVGNHFCYASDSVMIFPDDCEPSIYVPNCFTPNGDGYNDIFYASVDNVTSFTMLIFNRWGQMIFNSNDMNIGWDGKINGNTCPIGTYFYKINFTTPCASGIIKSDEQLGSVTLLE